MTSTNQLQQSGGGSEGDSSDESKHFTVTRIYSDEDGQSRFGSFKIRMDGSGNVWDQLEACCKSCSVA